MSLLTPLLEPNYNQALNDVGAGVGYIPLYGSYNISSSDNRRTLVQRGLADIVLNNDASAAMAGVSVDVRNFYEVNPNARIGLRMRGGNVVNGVYAPNIPLPITGTGKLTNVAPNVWNYSGANAKQIAGNTNYNYGAHPALKLNIDFSDVASQTLNGSEIITVNDKSGNGRNFTQPTQARRPTLIANAIGNKSVARFDGIDDSLLCTYSGAPIIGNMRDYTIIGVMRSNVRDTSSRFLCEGATATTGALTFGQFASNRQRLSYDKASDGGTVVARVTSLDGDVTYPTTEGATGRTFDRMAYDGLPTFFALRERRTDRQVTSQMILNGETFTVAIPAASGDGFLGGTFNYTKCALGCRSRAADDAFFAGDFGQLLVFEGYLSDDEMADIFATLTTQWQSTGNLLLQWGQSNADGRAANNTMSTALNSFWTSNVQNAMLRTFYKPTVRVGTNITNATLNTNDGELYYLYGISTGAVHSFAQKRTSQNVGNAGTTVEAASNTQFGSELSFAQAHLAAFPNTPLFISKVAIGGSSINDDWGIVNRNEGRIWQFAVDMHYAQLLRTLRTRGIRILQLIFLWVQGESLDADDATGALYQARLQALVSRVNTELGVGRDSLLPAACKIIISRLPTTGSATVRTAQAAVVAATPNARLLNTDGYGLQGDNIHFTGAAYESMGVDAFNLSQTF